MHFQDDAELQDQVFLKPKWVSDLIILVIESDEVVAGDGVLTRAHCNELWAEVDYQIRDHFTRPAEGSGALPWPADHRPASGGPPRLAWPRRAAHFHAFTHNTRRSSAPTLSQCLV